MLCLSLFRWFISEWYTENFSQQKFPFLSRLQEFALLALQRRFLLWHLGSRTLERGGTGNADGGSSPSGQSAHGYYVYLYISPLKDRVVCSTPRWWNFMAEINLVDPITTYDHWDSSQSWEGDWLGFFQVMGSCWWFFFFRKILKFLMQIWRWA